MRVWYEYVCPGTQSFPMYEACNFNYLSTSTFIVSGAGQLISYIIKITVSKNLQGFVVRGIVNRMKLAYEEKLFLAWVFAEGAEGSILNQAGKVVYLSCSYAGRTEISVRPEGCPKGADRISFITSTIVVFGLELCVLE